MLAAGAAGNYRSGDNDLRSACLTELAKPPALCLAKAIAARFAASSDERGWPDRRVYIALAYRSSGELLSQCWLVVSTAAPGW